MISIDNPSFFALKYVFKEYESSLYLLSRRLFECAFVEKNIYRKNDFKGGDGCISGLYEGHEASSDSIVFFRDGLCYKLDFDKKEEVMMLVKIQEEPKSTKCIELDGSRIILEKEGEFDDKVGENFKVINAYDLIEDDGEPDSLEFYIPDEELEWDNYGFFEDEDLVWDDCGVVWVGENAKKKALYAPDKHINKSAKEFFQNITGGKGSGKKYKNDEVLKDFFIRCLGSTG
ncbi:hypothetical protein [Endozoicomonas sp. Mp262]|uniref:hypothetical protein n=1 Tax=Endozoicomonas sp. Mp262 TaxID=2919499 RepID=UPI0021D7F6F3